MEKIEKNRLKLEKLDPHDQDTAQKYDSTSRLKMKMNIQNAPCQLGIFEALDILTSTFVTNFASKNVV